MTNYLKELNLNTEVIDGKSLFLPNRTIQQATENEYEKLANSKKVFMVQIAAAGPDGSLRVGLGEQKVGIIPNNEILSKTRISKKELLSFVNREIPVVVTGTGEDGTIVFLSILKAKEIVREHYRKTLKKGSVVNAIVVHYNAKNHRILLDIEGCGIYAYVPLRQWGYKYVYDPETQIKKGTITKVVIEEFYKDRSIGDRNYKAHYRCSRTSLLKNPWIGIETRCPVGTELVVTATTLTDHNFFASTSISDEIEVFCEYPDNYNSAPILNATIEDRMAEPVEPKVIIQKGEKYIIEIYKVSEEKKALMGRVKKVLSTTPEGMPQK